MKQRNKSTMLCLCLFVITCALVGADLVGMAQNTNSSTTTEPTMQNTNTGTRRAGRRRGRAAARTTNTNTGDMTGNENTGGENTNMAAENTNMTGDPAMQNTNDNTGTTAAPTTGRRGRRGRRRAAAAPAVPPDTATDTTGTMASGAGMSGGRSALGRVGEAASLDGTYTGMINYPDGSMTGDATLTITGNTFTLESGGNTQTGTLTTQTWPGYTAVSMRFGTDTPAKIVSLRARKTGTGLWLNSVGGEGHAFSFHTMGGGSMGGRRRRGRRRGATPTTPVEMPAPPPPAA